MWELHAIADRIMSFIAFRHHVYFFYLNVPSQTFGVNEQENLSRRCCNKPLLRKDEWMHVVDPLWMNFMRFFVEFGPRAQELEYIIHPMFIQNPSVYVPVTYLSPAVPHLVIYASVCKAWNDSVARVLTDKHMLDFRRLLVCSHQRHFVSHWIHRSSEDRFRVNAQLVPEIRLLVTKRPLQ